MNLIIHTNKINHAWYLACKEIIARCVAPNMYANAMDLLEIAYKKANERVNHE